jgi:predicted TIM-barrel fold metal-dependent hydrolase
VEKTVAYIKKFITFCSIPCLVFLCVISCSEKSPDFYSLKKIDSHVHLRTYNPAFVQQAVADNFALLTICTRSSNQTYIDEQFKFATYLHEKFPQTVAFSYTFSMENWGTSGWQDHTISQLEKGFESGAVAVKVWKDIGMTFRKPDSSFITIDDPSFDPVFDYIASAGKTVVAHIGEPRNCWLPVDSMTVISDSSYYSRNPQYHMYLHPEYPSYEDHINARDYLLEKHPHLKLVGAHLGSLEWSVDELAKRLDKYPNFAVDMSARVCHLQVQDRQKVRDFIIKYQDRLLYGTDTGVSEDADMEAISSRIHNVWLRDWNYFTTDAEMTAPQVRKPFRGLKLPASVLHKIYYQNAQNWILGLGA